MPATTPGVSAAPNSASITARILRAQRSTQYPDKWELEFEILASRSAGGGNFARVGSTVKGFTFAPAWELALPALVEAEAEYIGGPQGGLFQLTQLHPQR